MTIIDDNDNDNDDDIFDDSIDVVAIAPKRKLQRDLLGNIIDTYEPITPQSKPIDHPTHHDIDYNNLKTYIYPINYEIRDYQFNIIEKSFYNNMLVALPTGLGKTFIAATVILNYYRWFPQGKIIFMAPTKPLVAQQVKACFDIIGLRDQFAILLDKAKKNRQPIWDEKQIFFTTPQVVENDLTAGLINPKLVSLLIIDEAHKSKGNYAYNNVVKFLNRFNNSFRILALTATPSATVEEYRESALEIVTTIESLNDKDLAPHIFIGQAPESNSGVDMPSSPNSKKSSSEDAKLKGMNQKVQKQLIKDFKGSKYNILVATSIGEEGLDIGEVDLIVCYDCTSSPIKNIQRLGRTGRKRDGNILMLFADNERKKFDKAMDNYEFIQSYIMKNESDLVQDSPPNRMIPKNIKPSLEKIFIEPNNDLANEDDNDEIIKIATAYMKNSGSQKLKSKANPKEKNAKSNQKIQKQFFMPDNVETGFQNVSTMVKKKNHVKSVAEEKESDKLFDISNIMSSSSPSNSSQIQITSSQNMPDTEVKKQKSTLNSEQGSSGIDIVQFDSDEDSSLAIINNSSGNIKQKTDSKIQNEQEIKDDGHKEEDDSFDFDDGLDVDLVNLGKDSSEPPKKIIKLDKKVNSKSKDKNTTNDDDDDDKLTSNSFEPKDGVLTSQEKTDFYTNYYSPYVNQKFYEPIVTSSYPTNSNKTKLLQKINNLKELTPQQGQEIIAQYNVQASKISRS